MISGFVKTPILQGSNTPRDDSLYKVIIEKKIKYLSKYLPDLQEADVVARNMCDCLFSTKNPPQLHVEEKFKFRIFQTIGRMVSSEMQERLKI